MKPSLFVPLLAIVTLVMAALFIGCDRQPLEPVTDEALAPLSKVDRVEVTEEVFLDPLDEYIPCLGETVTWSGSWYFSYWTITTPSGNVIWHFATGYNTPTPLQAEGQTSGRIWRVTNGENHGGSITKPRGTAFMFHYQANEFYSTQNGERLHLRYNGRVMVDANGNVTQNREVWGYTCN